MSVEQPQPNPRELSREEVEAVGKAIEEVEREEAKALPRESAEDGNE